MKNDFTLLLWVLLNQIEKLFLGFLKEDCFLFHKIIFLKFMQGDQFELFNNLNTA